jgi:hypothetical protein
MSAFGSTAEISPPPARPTSDGPKPGHRPNRNPAVQQCYAILCPEHGRHCAVKRREFITLLGGAAAAVAARGAAATNTAAQSQCT